MTDDLEERLRNKCLEAADVIERMIGERARHLEQRKRLDVLRIGQRWSRLAENTPPPKSPPL